MRLDSALSDSLEGALQSFGARVRGIRGAVVADANGLPLAANVPGGFDVGVVAAMGALLGQSAGVAFENLKFSGPEAVIVEGKEANLAVLALPQGSATLLAILDKGANLGLVKIEMRRAADRIAKALGVGIGERARIAELFILYSSGLLIRHYSDTLRTDFDRDVLGGMLTAVQAFVRETLASRQGTLDEMRYGDHSICFVRGTFTIGAIIVTAGDCESAKYVVFDALKDFEEKY